MQGSSAGGRASALTSASGADARSAGILYPTGIYGRLIVVSATANKKNYHHHVSARTTDVNMHVTDVNMHVTDVNMHDTDVNMHVTDVNIQKIDVTYMFERTTCTLHVPD
jgi:hypothetical protein